MADLQINSSKLNAKMNPGSKKNKTYVDSIPELFESGGCITFSMKDPFAWYKAAGLFYFDAVDPDDLDHHTVEWKEHETKNPDVLVIHRSSTPTNRWVFL